MKKLWSQPPSRLPPCSRPARLRGPSAACARCHEGPGDGGGQTETIEEHSGPGHSGGDGGGSGHSGPG
jgi:hypothetical protein